MKRTRVILPSVLAALSVASHSSGAQESFKSSPSKIRYIDNGVIKVGVNLDLGGAITYVAKSTGGPNLINSFDWGRQIQMSHYSGPVPFAPNGKEPRKEWAGLGWNPIQSGDCYGNRSRVTYFKSDGKELTVRCIPMQWPLNNEPGECNFECKIKLDGNAVHVVSSLQNRRSDHTQWQGRDQELPAIYTNGPWYRLMTYTGTKPFTRGELTQIPAAFPWSGWQATENWAALVDDKNEGIGVFEPGAYRFIGGFAGKPGAGGEKDGPTGYIAPLQVEVLDYNIHYSFQYDLIVGDIKQIRDYVYKHAPHPAPPFYRFSLDRQHWSFGNAVDTGWPIKAAELEVSLEKQNPQLVGPASFWMAEEAPVLHVMGSFPPEIRQIRIFWSRSDTPGFNETCVKNFDIQCDNTVRDYTFRLADSPQYRGAIYGIRLDPVTDGLPGKFAHIRSIGFK
jgi:hypothetical protein